MKVKIKLVYGILTILLIFFTLSSNVLAQEYDISVDQNDEYVWEIKELDLNKFEATFGIEPNFQVGSRIRMIIREVTDIEGLRWSIVVDFWDYGIDWFDQGSIETLSIRKFPSQYDDYIIIPTPVSDYVEGAIESLPSQYYSLADNMIGKQDVSDLGIDFKVEKTYNLDGVMVSEKYLDEADLVIVNLEGIFQIIPFGFSFLGFLCIATLGIIIFVRKRVIKN